MQCEVKNPSTGKYGAPWWWSDLAVSSIPPTDGRGALVHRYSGGRDAGPVGDSNAARTVSRCSPRSAAAVDARGARVGESGDAHRQRVARHGGERWAVEADHAVVRLLRIWPVAGQATKPARPFVRLPAQPAAADIAGSPARDAAEVPRRPPRHARRRPSRPPFFASTGHAVSTAGPHGDDAPVPRFARTLDGDDLARRVDGEAEPAFAAVLGKRPENRDRPGSTGRPDRRRAASPRCGPGGRARRPRNAPGRRSTATAFPSRSASTVVRPLPSNTVPAGTAWNSNTTSEPAGPAYSTVTPRA